MATGSSGGDRSPSGAWRAGHLLAGGKEPMISRAPALSGTTPSPGHGTSSTVGKIAEQGPLSRRCSISVLVYPFGRRKHLFRSPLVRPHWQSSRVVAGSRPYGLQVRAKGMAVVALEV